LSERDRIKSNVIIRGLTEPSSHNLYSNIAIDKSTLAAIFDCISTDGPIDFKPIRLGESNATSTRPIKVIFKNHSTAAAILASFRALKVQSPAFHPHVLMVCDKTRVGREKRQACHSELDRRLEAGEVDLSIIYRNGILCVMSSRSKTPTSST